MATRSKHEYDEDPEIDDDLDVDDTELDDEDADLDDEDVEIAEGFTFETTPYTPEQLAERKVRRFKLDGDTLTAEQPDDAAYALLSQAVASAATNADRTHAILNFAWGTLDDRSKMIVQTRLYDKTDSFGLEMLASIVDTLLVDLSPDPQSHVNREARRNAARAKAQAKNRQQRPAPRSRR